MDIRDQQGVIKIGKKYFRFKVTRICKMQQREADFEVNMIELTKDQYRRNKEAMSNSRRYIDLKGKEV